MNVKGSWLLWLAVGREFWNQVLEMLLASRLSCSNCWIVLTSCMNCSKVVTSKKRGELSMLSFDSSPFKLFSVRFSNNSVQAPTCERPKTAQRTLFLLFANNNCFQITALCRASTHFSHHTHTWNNGIVQCTSSPIFEMTLIISSPS